MDRSWSEPGRSSLKEAKDSDLLVGEQKGPRKLLKETGYQIRVFKYLCGF